MQGMVLEKASLFQPKNSDVLPLQVSVGSGIKKYEAFKSVQSRPSHGKPMPWEPRPQRRALVPKPRQIMTRINRQGSLETASVVRCR